MKNIIAESDKSKAAVFFSTTVQLNVLGVPILAKIYLTQNNQLIIINGGQMFQLSNAIDNCQTRGSNDKYIECNSESRSRGQTIDDVKYIGQVRPKFLDRTVIPVR